MSVEIVYYNTGSMPRLEADLSQLGAVNASLCEDRRSFLVALSKAVSVSNTTVTVGAISTLSTVLSKALSLPLTPVDWSSLGIQQVSDVALPKGALPLIVGGSVYGMIIENAAQCIIAVDSDPQALEHVTETYVVPYLYAVMKDEMPVQKQPADQAPAEAEAEVAVAEEPAAPTPAKEVDEQPAEELAEQPADQAVAEEEVAEEEVAQESDLFSDIEDDDFLNLGEEKKKRGFWVALICILSVLILGIVGGYFAYTKWWLPKQYEEALNVAQSAYAEPSVLDAENIDFPHDYSVKFATLYKKNPDIIGWLKVDGLSIDTPIVTGANHSAGYYDNHLFDGQSNYYGTPHINNAYDTATNINPNLVVFGNNTKDGRVFSKVEDMLTVNGYKKVKSITTDSTLFGEEQWRVLSVMIVAADGSEYNFNDNFKHLSMQSRTDMVKDAVQRSRVNTGVTAEMIGEVESTDLFLTLVTSYSQDKTKVVVVLAEQITE